MTEKYGFVYLWFDRKHKRYYIGCRWGNINDSYICSSRWMMKSYKRRPQDFKRKILSNNIQCRKLLLEIEYNWLKLIRDEELGKKYYNLTNRKFQHWTTNPETRKTVGQKISESHKADPNWGLWAKDKKISEETKQKLREANAKQFEDKNQVELRINKSKELWADEEYRTKQTLKKVGRKQSPETIQKKNGI